MNQFDKVYGYFNKHDEYLNILPSSRMIKNKTTTNFQSNNIKFGNTINK